MLTWCKLHHVLQMRAVSHVLQRTMASVREEYPRITIPQNMIKKLEQHNLRKAREQAARDRLNLKTLLISSKRKEYQFYKGQKFDVFDPKRLASHGWKHRNCNHDYFTIMPHNANPAVAKAENVSFREFGLNEQILEYLHKEGIEIPTNIQGMVIPKMLAGKHVLCAAETGSGKTFAYLLPIVHQILQQSRDTTAEFSDDTRISPYAIIMVPTLELADQIMGVCEKLAEVLPCQPVLVKSGRKNLAKIRQDEGKQMDILISTPGVLKKLFERNYLSPSRLICIVLDEADTLLDDSFSDLSRSILRRLQVGRQSMEGANSDMTEGVQVALVSATFPRGLDRTVGEVLPIDSFEQLTTTHLHRLMPHVPQKFIKMKSADQLATLLSILKKKKNSTCIIFCNKQDACLFVSKSLEEMGLSNVCVTGFLMEEERHKQFRSFLDGETKILVCTDLASRGIDTHMVDHVINFDFPNFMSDYIHRAGRVGRVGAKFVGHVTSFVIHPWDVDLVWKIEIAARQQTELHNVNANIKRKINSLKPQKEGLNLHQDEMD